MTEQRIVVIDNGSYKLKCGYAGDEYPISYRSTVIYESKLKSTHNAIGTTSILGPNGLRQLKRPMEHRYKPDYDGLEQIWRKTFDETLKIKTVEYDKSNQLPISFEPKNYKDLMEFNRRIFQQHILYHEINNCLKELNQELILKPRN